MLAQKDITKALKTLETIGIDEMIVTTEAAMILNSATNTAKTILSKRAAMDAQGLQHKPLIVLAGERHDMPAHNLHHIAVLTQLKKAEPATGLAFELPHNTLHLAFKRELPVSIKTEPGTIAYIKKKLQNDFKSAAAHDLAYERHRYASYSRELLFRASLKDAIPVRFVDTAKITGDKNEQHIDTDDDSSRLSVEACLGHEAHDIETDSKDGMYVRNHHIVKTTKNFAAATKARIIIQHCGVTHIAGHYDWSTDEDLEETQALRHLFKKAGDHTLSQFLDEEDYQHFIINSDLGKRPKDVIQTLPLPYRLAHYESPSDENAARTQSQNTPQTKRNLFSSFHMEEAYVTALLAKMDMKKYGLSTANYFKERENYKKTVDQRLQNWRKALR